MKKLYKITNTIRHKLGEDECKSDYVCKALMMDPEAMPSWESEAKAMHQKLG